MSIIILMNTDQGLLCLEKKVYQLWQDMEHLTWYMINQTLGMIAGILASTGSAKGLNMADAKLGWSNKGVKGNVVESVTGNIETRVVVRLMY